MPPECSSCHAPILWASSGNGSPIPLDPEPVKGGNVELLPPLMGRPIAKVHGKPLETGYVAHFVTCPNAPKHRKRG